MSTTRVLTLGVLLLPGARIGLDEQRAHHVRDVLRHVVGDEIVVFDGAGVEADARIVELDGEYVEVLVVSRREIPTGAAPGSRGCRVELAIALLKGDRLDWVFEKATELGVSAIHPLECEHAVVLLRGERAASKAGRWQRLVEGAARQCERADVPLIAPVRTAAQGLAIAGEGAALRIVCLERGASEEPEFASVRRRGGRVVVAVGPEGGWSNAEKDAARTLGYQVLSLGARILRAETAAVAALAVVQRALGQLG